MAIRAPDGANKNIDLIKDWAITKKPPEKKQHHQKGKDKKYHPDDLDVRDLHG